MSALAVIVAVLFAGAGSSRAEDGEWREATTEHFVILYQTGDEAARDHLTANVEPLYERMAAAFGTTLSTPITVRLHPSVDSFLRANPLVVELEGVLAGPRRGRREMDIVLPLAGAAGNASLDNAARTELAGLLVGRLAGDHLPEPMAQGIAAWLAVPDDSLAGSVAALRDAWSRGTLPELDALGATGAEYDAPAATQAQARAVAQYLVDRSGFPTLLRWLAAVGTGTGWADALAATYGATPAEVDAAFRAWLPAYLDGGWRVHQLHGADPGQIEQWLRAGDYDEAMARLASASLLDIAPGGAQRLSELRSRAERGQAARLTLTEGARDLTEARYPAAAAAAEAAGATFAALGDQAGMAVSREAARRAHAGAAAESAVATAERLPWWRALEARTHARHAADTFATLGNGAGQARAEALARTHDQRLFPLGWVLVGAGSVVAVHNVRRRRRDLVEVASAAGRR